MGGRTSTTPIGNASVDTAFDQVAHHRQAGVSRCNFLHWNVEGLTLGLHLDGG